LRSIGKAGGEGACNRVFNQTIADEFNRSRTRGTSLGCQPAEVGDAGASISGERVISYHMLWFLVGCKPRGASFRQKLFFYEADDSRDRARAAPSVT
jgi:hypothetical protein